MTPPAIAGYEALEPIGRGGVGDVYRARHVASGAVVAIKILRAVDDESTAWRRCRRELMALLALGGHPNVVALLDVGAAAVGGGSAPALVMELMRHGSVADLIVERGHPLGGPTAVRVGAQAAAALAAAHARGIVHRDVKPHNLLIDDTGTVKLCDFGIAAISRSGEFRQATASVSLRFASPEDLEDDAEVGPAADVYSLGATLLYLARGEHLELRDRLVAWQPGAPSGAADDALFDLIAACLVPEPEARPTAAAVLEVLAALDAEIGAPLPVEIREPATLPAETLPRPVAGRQNSIPPAPPRPSPVAPRPHRRRVLVAALVTVLVIAAGVGWWLWRGPDGEASEPELRLVSRPAGLIELTALTWPATETGVCLVQRAGVAELEPVDCTEPHDLEQVGGGRLPEGVFVASDIDATVDAACATAVRRYAGQTASGLGVAVAVTRPSADGWANGDREYRCFVGAPDRRLAGSIALAPAGSESRSGTW